MSATNDRKTQPWLCIAMGVSACGKSSIGRAVTKQWNERLKHIQSSSSSSSSTDSLPARARFIDGDDYHSDSNRAKMGSGHPLSDSDRQEWLEKLGALMREAIHNGEGVVLACSSLKRSYRRVVLGAAKTLEEAFEQENQKSLTRGAEPHSDKEDTLPTHTAVKVVAFLDGSFSLLNSRISNRPDHYMKANMLQSQFDTLERPSEQELDPLGAHFVRVDLDKCKSIEEEAQEIVEYVSQFFPTLKQQQVQKQS